jgi:hypothetical protein
MTFAPRPDQYLPPTLEQLDKRLRAADKPGAHLWVMTAGWLIADPDSAYDPSVLKLMDRENIIVFAGPGCYKCERPYSKRLSRKTCRGSLELLQE